MLIDLYVAFACGIYLDPFLGGRGRGIFVIIALLLLFFLHWLFAVIRLAKNQDKSGMWATLLVGLLISFLIGGIISSFFRSEKKHQEKSTFYCSSCYVTYNNDLFGGKTERWGKICRYCLEKKHRQKDKTEVE